MSIPVLDLGSQREGMLEELCGIELGVELRVAAQTALLQAWRRGDA